MRGSEARIRSEVGGDTLVARVKEVLPIGIGDGRTVPVRIVLPSGKVRLSPGLSVTASIILSPARPMPIVPAEALHMEGDRSYVLLVVDGRVDRRAVMTGPTDGIRTAISSGVSIGDKVITKAPATLSAGVRVTETPGETAP
jgi:multidrug efflux pump subunit AcrA (membrane-fusion protein)